MHIFNFAGDTTHGFSIKLLKISLHCHPAVGISMVVTIGRKCPIKFSPFCQRKRLVLNRMLMVSLHSPAGAYREVVIPLESVSMISMSERQADAFQPLCCLELTSARLTSSPFLKHALLPSTILHLLSCVLTPQPTSL